MNKYGSLNLKQIFEVALLTCLELRAATHYPEHMLANEFRFHKQKTLVQRRGAG